MSIQPCDVQCAGQLTPEGSLNDAGGSHQLIWLLLMMVICCDDGCQLELHDQDADGAQPIALRTRKKHSVSSWLQSERGGDEESDAHAEPRPPLGRVRGPAVTLPVDLRTKKRRSSARVVEGERRARGRSRERTS